MTAPGLLQALVVSNFELITYLALCLFIGGFEPTT